MSAKNDDSSQNLRLVFHERINGIEQEMKKIDGCLNDFLATMTKDFSRLINMIELMRENMVQLKRKSSKI